MLNEERLADSDRLTEALEKNLSVMVRRSEESFTASDRQVHR